MDSRELAETIDLPVGYRPEKAKLFIARMKRTRKDYGPSGSSSRMLGLGFPRLYTMHIKKEKKKTEGAREYAPRASTTTRSAPSARGSDSRMTS